MTHTLQFRSTNEKRLVKDVQNRFSLAQTRDLLREQSKKDLRALLAEAVANTARLQAGEGCEAES